MALTNCGRLVEDDLEWPDSNQGLRRLLLVPDVFGSCRMTDIVKWTPDGGSRADPLMSMHGSELRRALLDIARANGGSSCRAQEQRTSGAVGPHTQDASGMLLGRNDLKHPPNQDASLVYSQRRAARVDQL